MAVQVDLSRLLSTLNRTGLAKDNNSLYQVIKGLIDFIQKNFANINSSISSSSGSSSNAIIQTIGPPGLDGIDGEDGLSIPGPIGPAGIQGPQGQDGQIIFLEDSIEPDFIPALVGPQGNPGPTGSQGPIGGYFPVEDGLDGEDGLPGPPGINGTNGSSDVLVARVVLSDAQIKSGNTSPVQIIAAPGATSFINIISCITIKDSTSGVYSATPNFRVRYNSLTDDLVTATSLFLSTANKRWQRLAIAALGNTSNPLNKAVEVSLAADVTGGNAANYLAVQVTYTIIQDGP